MRNSMAYKTIPSPYMSNIRIELHDKIIEFKQRTEDLNQFAKHMKYFNQFSANNSEYENIKQTIKETWDFIGSGKPFKPSDETGMKHAIEQIDKVIQKLNQFTQKNYTIVSDPSLSALQELTKAKQIENNELVEYIKKHNPLSNDFAIGINANLFYQNINLSDFNKNLKENLKNTVKHFDLAISNMKQNAKNMKKVVLKEDKIQK